MYQRGGVFCITSRILIVDLLSNVINPQDIDGMMIGHADQVTNESTEAFIIRIYTSQKRRSECFIKAFTDSPEGLLSGFAKIDKTLKALQVRQLYLYPRFHDFVRNELEKHPPDVEELHQPLSPGTIIFFLCETDLRTYSQSDPTCACYITSNEGDSDSYCCGGPDMFSRNQKLYPFYRMDWVGTFH